MSGRASLLRSVVVGTLLGIAVLGVGGRFAMRWYANLDYQPTYFTAGGTLTVLLNAAAAGAASGFWLWLGRKVLARPLHQQLFFWVGLALLTWRVLNPISTQRVMVFAPLSLVQGVALSFATRAPRGSTQTEFN
jgi:hypothetical protein